MGRLTARRKGSYSAQAWQGRGPLAMASSWTALAQGMTVLMTGAVPITDSQLVLEPASRSVNRQGRPNGPKRSRPVSMNKEIQR